MLTRLKQLSKQTLIYGLGDAVTRLVGLILLPIYTRFLTPTDYGKLAIATLIPTVMSLILEAGMRSAFFRFYLKDDKGDRGKLTGTVLIFLLASAAIILTPIILFFNTIALPVFNDASLLPLVQIALIGTFFELGSVVPFAIFRAEQRAAQYAGLAFARFLINASLGITALVVLRWGVPGVIYANLLTSALFFLVCLLMTIRSVEWTVDLKLLKRVLVFGLPLVPANLAGWGLTFSDRFFLERYTDLSQVGVYAIGYSIAGVLNMMMGWFNTAWLPYGYSVAEQPDAKTFYARILTYALALFTLIGLGLSLFAGEALYVLTTPGFYGAARIVPFIVVAYLFFEMNYLISLGLDLTGKTNYYVLIVGAAALVNLILNFLLIPHFGIMGAAIATGLSYMFIAILTYLIVRRLYPVSYERRRLLKLAGISLGTYLLGIALKTGNLWFDLAIGIVLTLSWGAGLYWGRFFTEPELSAARAVGNTALRGSGKRGKPQQNSP